MLQDATSWKVVGAALRPVMLTLCLLVGSWPAAGQTTTEDEPRGVVVEEVGEGSALEKAGLRPGDVVFAWERLPNPPANPQAAQGELASPFDWMGIEVEQAPRGTVKLTGQRDGEVRVFEVGPGKWKATLRARMPEGMPEDYARGKDLIEAEELEAGIDLWHKVARRAENQAADGGLRCWLLLRIGDVWGKARQWEKAHDAYRFALEAAQTPLVRITIWQAVGDTYKKTSEFETAREAYGSAQEIREKIWGESLAFAKGLNSLGGLDWRQGRLHAAQGYWQRALEIRQKLAPGSLVVAWSLNNMGALAYDHGELDRAAKYYEGSMEIKQKLAPGSLDLAGSLNNLGNLARSRGDLDRAAEYYEGSLEIKQKLAPASLNVAMTLNNLGLLAHTRGDWVRAIEYYEGSLKIGQKLAPGSLEVAVSLNNLGNLAADRGDFDRAVEYYKRSLEIKQKLVPGSLGVAESLNNLGILAADRGDFDRAIEYYKRSLEIKQKLAPGSLTVASSLNNLGALAYERDDLDRAVEYYKRSLEIERKLAPGSLDVAARLNNLGLLAYERGDLDRAAEYYEGALEIKQKLAPGSLNMVFSLGNMGHLASGRGDLDRAAEYYEGALEIQQKLAPGSLVEAELLHVLATIRRQQSHPQPALALFLEALQALENQVTRLGGSRDVQAGFRAERVAYYRDTIDLSLGLQQPGEAFHTLERSRARSFLAQLAERDLVFSDIPEELDRNRRRVAVRYDQTQQELAELNLSKDKEEIEALQGKLRHLQGERDDIEEQIRRDYPNLAALQYPQPLELQAAQQALDPETLMLSYSVGEESSHLFVVSKGHPLKVHELPVGEKELRQQIEDFQVKTYRGAWRRRTASRVELAKLLYKTLIEPAEDAIRQSERLLIIADGPLHLLPFAALVRDTEAHEERPWQYLVEWKPMHSVLSATVYTELKKLRAAGQPASETPIALAAFGDPLYPQELQLADLEAGAETIRIASLENVPDVYVRSAAERGSRFPPLPYTRQEVQQIASLYPGAQTYLGADATEERAKSIGKDVRILHFATHGTLDHRFPLNSAVALTLPEELPEGRENGLLQAWEIFERVRLDADLVVLSACESGLGQELGGEGLIGLTRAFQYAGARTVAATLWKVPDRTTAVLMERFYRHLKAGQPKDEALRAAQLELIRGPIEVTGEDGALETRDASAPYYWAAFQIYGDWQ